MIENREPILYVGLNNQENYNYLINKIVNNDEIFVFIKLLYREFTTEYSKILTEKMMNISNDKKAIKSYFDRLKQDEKILIDNEFIILPNSHYSNDNYGTYNKKDIINWFYDNDYFKKQYQYFKISNANNDSKIKKYEKKLEQLEKFKLSFSSVTPENLKLLINTLKNRKEKEKSLKNKSLVSNEIMESMYNHLICFENIKNLVDEIKNLEKMTTDPYSYESKKDRINAIINAYNSILQNNIIFEDYVEKVDNFIVSELNNPSIQDVSEEYFRYKEIIEIYIIIANYKSRINKKK